MSGEYIREGKKNKKYLPLEANDMKKVSDHFTRRSPTVLQYEVMFNVIYYFGQRGREHIRNLKRSDFNFCLDDSGKEYIEINRSMPSKNVNPSMNKNDL